MSEYIKSDIQDHILRIRIDRADKLNAFDVSMYQAMTEAILIGERNPEVRVIFLCGIEKSFSSGNDLKDFIDNPPEDLKSPAMIFLQTISQAQKPLVAATSGLAVGIGSTLLLHCDLAYSSLSCRFKLPFTQLGLCPEAASSLLMPQLMGHRKACELLLLGDFFDAKTAKEVGLINAIYSVEDLESLAWEQAKKLAKLPPKSLISCKQLLKQSQQQPTARHMAIEMTEFIDLLKGNEFKEAIAAFKEKRPANFDNLD